MKKKLIIIFCLLLTIPAFAFENIEESKQELITKLESLSQSDTSRLKVLSELIKLTDSKPAEQIDYINMLLESAEALHSKYYTCSAYLDMIYMAYNNYDYESAVKWKNKLEPLAYQEGLYDMMFKGKRVVLELLVLDEEFEKLESESQKMYQEASLLNNKLGMILAKQLLSHVYIITFRSNEAILVLEEALALEPSSNSKFEIYSTIIDIYRILGDKAGMFRYTMEYDKLIQTHIKENPTYLDMLMLNYILLTDYYIKVDNKELAAQYNDSVHRYFSTEYSDMYKLLYYDNCFKYYYYAKQYDKVIEYIDTAISLTSDTFFNNYYVRYFIIKADMLRNINKSSEAVIWYRKGVEQLDSLRLVKITKQEEYLKNKFDAHNYLLQSKTISNYNNRVIIIAIVIILIVLICFIYYTAKVRRQLQKDEHEMRMMSDEMEIASKAKDNFLNNIGNSISVPLNYIVENSQRLGSEEEFTPEQKRDLSASLRVNSSKLMAMINDILDFSRLEAGMMKLTKESTGIIGLINDTITEESQYRKINLSWQLPEGGYEYVAVVDILRFQALIKSTLQPTAENSAPSVSMSDDQENKELSLIIKNSWLAVVNPSQDIIIRNEINRSMMLQFDGLYQIDTATNTILIKIKYTVESADRVKLYGLSSR